MNYTVKAGDTLWGIAQQQLGSGDKWTQLGYKGDPRQLPVGTVLNIPDNAKVQQATGGQAGVPDTSGVYGTGYDQLGNLLPSNTTPSTASAKTGQNPIDYPSAYSAAATLYGNGGQDITNLGVAASNIQAASTQESQNILAEAPAVQSIYSDIIKQLGLSENTEIGAKQTEKTQALSSQATSAAAQGFDPTTGFEASLSRGTSQVYDTQIGQIADKYGLQFDQVAQEETKDLSDLTTRANDALIQGDIQTASMLKDIISLKQGQASIIQSAAQNIISAGQEQEKIDLSKYTPVTVYNPQTGQTTIVPFSQQTGQLGTGTPIQGTTSKSAAAQYPQPQPNDQNAIAAWATDVRNGTATMSQVPQSIRTQVAQLVSQQ